MRSNKGRNALAWSALALAISTGAASAQEVIFDTQDFAPFSYMKGGDVAGPGVDVIKAVCKEAGLACAFNLLPWARAQSDVKAGKAHALFLIGWNAERETWLSRSPAVVVTEYGFFVPLSDRIVIRDMAQLKDYSVAVYGPSNTQATLEKVKAGVPGMALDVSPDDESAFRKADSERVRAVFSNRDVGNAMIAKIGLKNLRYAGKQSDLNYYIGFSKEFTPAGAVDKFNAAYKRLYQSGEIQRILKSYKLDPAAPD
jgi:polar amino acid transport system substrate-binding protein